MVEGFQTWGSGVRGVLADELIARFEKTVCLFKAAQLADAFNDD